MALTLELTPGIHAQLEAQASKSGMSVEKVVIAMIVHKLGGTYDECGTANSQKDSSEVNERVRPFDEMIESFSDIQAPEIPAEALRRENLYDD